MSDAYASDVLVVVRMLLLILATSAVLSSAQECLPFSVSCNYTETKYDNQTYPGLFVNSLGESGEYYSSFITFFGEDKCSSDDQLFLCAAIFPSCETGLGPCQSLCEKVREGCLTILNMKYSLNEFSSLSEEIPILLDCDRYTTSNCVEPSQSLPTSPTLPSLSPTPLPSLSPIATNSTRCPVDNASYFTDSDKSFAVGWIATWATLCFISTLVTILTFFISRHRFQYPWRPVVYLALSFNIHSLGYFLALVLGSIVTCPGNEFVSSTVSWGWQHVPCILVFGLLYYSMMAAFLWWLVLAVCWFLASALKWSSESIGHIAPFFHVVSWVVPLLMMICLVAARVISADELSGICFIVRDESTSSFYALLLGVILPLMVFLLVGIFFLTVGLVSVCRVRRFLQHKGRDKETVVLEKLMVRIGVFITVYIVPASVVIGCFFYELVSQPSWATVDELEQCDGCSQPNTSIFMVRILLFLLIGILTGVWIWSRKTLRSWKRCFVSVKDYSLGDNKKKICKDQHELPMDAYYARNPSPPAIIPGFQQYPQDCLPVEIPPPPPPPQQYPQHCRQGSLPSTIHS